MSNVDLYLGLNVFRRIDSGEVIIYRCFRKLPKGGYTVQSADRVKLPLDNHQCRQHENQFMELLIEEAPEARSSVFRTIEEAIDDFELSFDERG